MESTRKIGLDGGRRREGGEKEKCDAFNRELKWVKLRQGVKASVKNVRVRETGRSDDHRRKCSE